MALDLPPVGTPQQAPAAELLSQYHGGISVPFGKLQIFVFGPAMEAGAVAPERLRADVARAETVSEAVHLIGYLYYVSGDPAELTQYALADATHLYVRVAPGRLAEVRGAPQYQPYFAGLAGTQPLQGADFERARALADVLSRREGLHYSPAFVPLGADAVALDLGQPAPGEPQAMLRASFSNYGNRYSGPYLADASLRRGFSSGDELVLGGVTSVRFLDLGGPGSEPYHEGDLQWSHITPLGLFSFDARYADFALDSQGLRFGGSLATGAASWLYPVYDDLQQRLNLVSKLERSHESIHAQGQTVLGPDPQVLSDLYNSAELGLGYAGRSSSGGRLGEWSASATVRKGLSPRPAGDPSNPGYLLWRIALAGKYGAWNHLSPGLSIEAQLGGSAVPQLEQFVLGGPASAHAYDAGAGAGDRGWNSRAGIEWKGAAGSWAERHGLRPRLFVEYGGSRRGAPAPGSVAVADVGLESDIRFTPWLGGTVSAALPFHEEGREHSPDNLRRNCVFFRLAAQY
jgi:hemolysin activation/secretion protein